MLLQIVKFSTATSFCSRLIFDDTLRSALEKNDFWFHAIFTPYFFEKYGGRWETYGIYGVVEDDILSILWNFGFSSIRPFSVRGLRSYYIKAKGWIIKMAVNKPFLYQFWWNLVCSLLLEPHLHRKILSKVVKAKSQKVARSKGQNSKNLLQTIWVKPKPFSWFYINFQAKRTHFLKFCVRAHSAMHICCKCKESDIIQWEILFSIKYKYTK